MLYWQANSGHLLEVNQIKSLNLCRLSFVRFNLELIGIQVHESAFLCAGSNAPQAADCGALGLQLGATGTGPALDQPLHSAGKESFPGLFMCSTAAR